MDFVRSGAYFPHVGCFESVLHFAFLDGVPVILADVPVQQFVRFFSIDHQIFGYGVGFVCQRFAVLLEPSDAVLDAVFGLFPYDVVDKFPSHACQAVVQVKRYGVAFARVGPVDARDYHW